jgi:hypothetical protein
MRSRKVPRRKEERISDPAAYPKETVNFSVAAEFLEMDRRALNAYVDQGDCGYEWRGRRRRIRVSELVRFKAWLSRRAASF